jgi:hypothetical protein
MSERRITKEEAIERVERHLRGGAFGTYQKKAEEIVEAIGAWEEEDKPPELPEGWRVVQTISSTGVGCVVEVTGRIEHGLEVWTFRSVEGADSTRRFLARALAALRQDDGEVDR